MVDYTRQHNPDQVPSEMGPYEGAQPPQIHDTPEAVCRDTECPRQLQPATPPPRHGFWDSLTEIERAALLASAEEIVYPVGTVLWFEGQAADQAVIIRSGSIRVSVERGGHERIIAFRGPGDIVGERAALLLRRRSATIVAMDTVHGLRMTTQQFVTYLSDHPRVVAIMEREVYDRLTEQPGVPQQTPPSYAHTAHHEPQSPYLTGTQPGYTIAAHQPYAPGPQPNTVATQPYATGMQPYATEMRPHAIGAQPYAAGTTHPHATAAQPYRTDAQPYAVGTTQPYAVGTQPYAVGTQPYGTAGQAYAPGPTPLTYPAAGQAPDPAAAGGAAYMVQSQGGGSWPVHPVAATSAPSHAQATQPMAISPPGPEGLSWAGQNCTIVYTDIAGFSASHRNDADRLDMRRAMYAVLREAFEASRVPWDACHTEDRGDGALIVVPPEVPTAAVIDPMLTALAVRLRRHNQRSSGAVRIQLRVAVDVGPVMPDPPGVTGWALIHTARLLDARPLKDRLAATGADLGFIASQFVYESVITHSAGHVNPAEYEPISCRVKKLKTEGWIHLRGVPAQSAV
ncbi:cyclic nucleotide-binding domain-containing protein [Spirillospora sp. NPDC048819]|uniref:cyclic nucleotide-binding domain-containing protein n=1 Tax=Spirillospora sp. NPDC048819 TaxID=3155268 RepID=UPI0033FE8916